MAASPFVHRMAFGGVPDGMINVNSLHGVTRYRPRCPRIPVPMYAGQSILPRSHHTLTTTTTSSTTHTPPHTLTPPPTIPISACEYDPSRDPGIFVRRLIQHRVGIDQEQPPRHSLHLLHHYSPPPKHSNYIATGSGTGTYTRRHTRIQIQIQVQVHGSLSTLLNYTPTTKKKAPDTDIQQEAAAQQQTTTGRPPLTAIRAAIPYDSRPDTGLRPGREHRFTRGLLLHVGSAREPEPDTSKLSEVRSCALFVSLSFRAQHPAEWKRRRRRVAP